MACHYGGGTNRSRVASYVGCLPRTTALRIVDFLNIHVSRSICRSTGVAVRLIRRRYGAPAPIDVGNRRLRCLWHCPDVVVNSSADIDFSSLRWRCGIRGHDVQRYANRQLL
jgi:hypothetical protein